MKVSYVIENKFKRIIIKIYGKEGNIKGDEVLRWKIREKSVIKHRILIW